jgi:hypothetical protein
MEERKKMGRPPLERKRTAALRVRCYPEWLAWLNAVASAKGIDTSDITEEAIRQWAARRKDLPPMPER